MIAAAAASVGLLLAADQIADPGRFSPANDGVFYGVLVGGPVLTGWLISERAAQVAELALRTTELAERRPAVVRAARVEETARVERAIHRALAGRVEQMVAGIRAAAESGTPHGFVEVEDTARAALTELRALLGTLGSAARSVPPGDAPRAAPVPTPRPPRLDRVDAALFLAGVPLAIETAVSGPGPTVGNVVLALGQGAMLPVIRRRPVLGATALVVLATVQTLWWAPVPTLVSWLLPGLLTSYLTGTAARLASAVAGLVVTVAGVVLISLVTPEPDRSLSGLAPSLVLGLLAWWAGRAVAGRERRARELAELAEALAGAEAAQAHAATAEQRSVLARELHDVGAHAFTVVCLQAGAARRQWLRNPDQAGVAVDALVTLAQGSLPALGRSMSGLADAGLDDTHPGIDPGAVDILAGFGGALGLDVRVAVHGPPRPLPATVGRTAFRVVQESLTNAARHAACGRVAVDIVYRADVVEVTVQDTGPRSGLPAVSMDGAGLGLAGMQARVEACCGTLDFGPTGSGFRVHACLPVSA